MARFTNKIIIVTGGGSGIGRATCEQFAREGGTVIIAGRNEAEGAESMKAIRDEGGKADAFSVDVGIPDQIKACVDYTVSTYGRIDVMVNNAAMMTFKPIVDLDPQDWDNLMSVNLRAVFLFSKYCLPHMKGGAIINISSVHAHQTTPNVVPYAASKGGLEAFTRGLSREIEPTQARINAIAPGAVDTPMLWSNPNVQSGKEKIEGAIGKPEDLAAAICFLASDEAKYIHGTTLAVDGGRLAML
jgi:NAD(P)-dependent dehydrogenase (short-subunit alcohol dehydrogenase family)